MLFAVKVGNIAEFVNSSYFDTALRSRSQLATRPQHFTNEQVAVQARCRPVATVVRERCVVAEHEEEVGAQRITSSPGPITPKIIQIIDISVDPDARH